MSHAREPVDSIVEADAVVEKRARPLVRPLRRLVNAPHLLVVTIVVIWTVCSMLYGLIEHKGPVESMWWGIVTGTTVGYGDTYPGTTAGRGVAVVLILTMVVLVPIAIGHVIANLVLDRNQFTHDEQVALAETIESVHDQVEMLQHLLMASLSERHGEEWVRQRVEAWERGELLGGDVDDRMLRLFQSAEE